MLDCVEHILQSNLAALLNLTDEIQESLNESLLDVNTVGHWFNEKFVRVSRQIKREAK